MIDFQAPLTHTLVKDNAKKKGRFEKMFLEGRPPVALGVTSGGDAGRKAEIRIPPYEWAWSTQTVADGQHTIAAVAKDVAGNTSSAQRTVTVSNQPD